MFEGAVSVGDHYTRRNCLYHIRTDTEKQEFNKKVKTKKGFIFVFNFNFEKTNFHDQLGDLTIKL